MRFPSPGKRYAVCPIVFFTMLLLASCSRNVDHADASELATTSAGRSAAHADSAAVPDRLTISRTEYRDHLIGLWLAECIANWTGLITEGQRTEAPFYSDEDWGTRQGRKDVEGSKDGLLDFSILDPWLADDDTDIEYIYIEAMARKGSARLSPEDIRAAWLRHIHDEDEDYPWIWVSNWKADSLMRAVPAVLPPSTSLLAANDQSLMIDAQLTTEIFGALAPGMPGEALDLADLPIRATASGYATHAAQFHVALYSLAIAVDSSLSPRDQVLWMVRTARRLIPDSSKSADVIDLVLEDYLSNPDGSDWERTRNLLYDRFHANDEAHGYRFLEWYEAPVNLGAGLVALLYGEGDLKDTVRIGSLSGWDSDNGTASMGGLLGLMLGVDGVRAAFPEHELSLQYKIDRTRKGFAEPVVSMTAIADRLLPIIDQVVVEAGGSVEDEVYRIPRPRYDELNAANDNPRSREHVLSVNNAAGMRPKVQVTGGKPGANSATETNLVDGLEFDFSGRDRKLYALKIETYQKETARNICIRRDSKESVTFEIVWDKPVPLNGIRFVEGAQGEEGGYFESLQIWARLDNAWRMVESVDAYAPRTERSFEVHALRFREQLRAGGIRLQGRPGGSAGYVTLCEIDGLRAVENGLATK